MIINPVVINHNIKVYTRFYHQWWWTDHQHQRKKCLLMYFIYPRLKILLCYTKRKDPRITLLRESKAQQKSKVSKSQSSTACGIE